MVYIYDMHEMHRWRRQVCQTIDGGGQRGRWRRQTAGACLENDTNHLLPNRGSVLHDFYTQRPRLAGITLITRHTKSHAGRHHTADSREDKSQKTREEREREKRGGVVEGTEGRRRL